MEIIKRNLTRAACLAVLVAMATILLSTSTAQADQCMLAPECSGPYPEVVCPELCARYGFNKDGYCKESQYCCCRGAKLAHPVLVNPSVKP
uniref:Knottin scorpion toxin-like domain-containing protein n=1 Tax=Aegilops tauschii TaxID=37682 RepID=M8CEF3_AEGTA